MVMSCISYNQIAVFIQFKIMAMAYISCNQIAVVRAQYKKGSITYGNNLCQFTIK